MSQASNQKSDSALYSANSRYNQKLISGKAPTQNEIDAHQILEERKMMRTSPTSPRYNHTPVTKGLSNVYQVSITPPRAQSPRGRKKEAGVRSPRTLSPEAKAKAILNVTNARYAKKLKNGGIPTQAEIDAHNEVERNKVNSPRAQSPASNRTEEEKRYTRSLTAANARYAKKIKNGGIPTQAETDAHNEVERNKINRLSPVSSPISSPRTYTAPNAPVKASNNKNNSRNVSSPRNVNRTLFL